MDVSNWDGLKKVEKPNEKPFYHIYPDATDCISAFGGPRHFRYVCQDNLELSLDKNPLKLTTDLDPEWKWDRKGGKYVPSIEMKVSLFYLALSLYLHHSKANLLAFDVI